MARLGKSVRLLAVLTDFDGKQLTPDTQEVQILDPQGTVKFHETNPTKKADGVYYVTYTFEGIAGGWTIKWDVTKSGLSGGSEKTLVVSE